MAGSLAVGGLASGLDTQAIVDALVGVKEAQLITPLQNHIADTSEKYNALKNISDLMVTMRGYADKLTIANAFSGRGATSSDDSVVRITSTGYTAALGTYSVNVNALAQSDRNYFTGVADKSTSTFGTGTFQITSSGVTIDVTIDGTNNTLQGIANAINATDGAPVTATIVNDGTGATPYRLVLTSDATGADADIVQNISSVLSLTDDAALNADATNMAQDASIVVNGLTVNSSTNTFSSIIQGVSFVADSLATDVLNPVRVSVSQNTSAVEEAIVDFFGAYNDVMASLTEQFTYDTASKTAGPLSTDVTLQSAQAAIHRNVFQYFDSLGTSAYKSVSQIGITMEEDGSLTIDAGTLESALSSDPEAVGRLFQGNSITGGIAQDTYDYLYKLTNGADGTITTQLSDYIDSIGEDKDQIDVYQADIDAYQARLEAKFVYMEQVLSQLSVQSDAIESLANSLQSISDSKK